MTPLSNNDEKYAANAYIEACKSQMAMQHGCIAVRSGKIIAKGHNKCRTYSKDGLIYNSCSCHAEIDVLRKCKKLNITNKLNLYIVRRSIDDCYTQSSPCLDCFETMKKFDIKYIVFSTITGELYKCSFDKFRSTHETSGRKAILENRVKLVA